MGQYGTGQIGFNIQVTQGVTFQLSPILLSEIASIRLSPNVDITPPIVNNKFEGWPSGDPNLTDSIHFQRSAKVDLGSDHFESFHLVQNYDTALIHFLLWRGFLPFFTEDKDIWIPDINRCGLLLSGGNGFVYDSKAQTLYTVSCPQNPYMFRLGNNSSHAYMHLINQGRISKNFQIKSGDTVDSYIIESYSGIEEITSYFTQYPSPRKW